MLKELNYREMQSSGEERRRRRKRREASAKASARPVEPDRKIRLYTGIMIFVTFAFLALAAILSFT